MLLLFPEGGGGGTASIASTAAILLVSEVTVAVLGVGSLIVPGSMGTSKAGVGLDGGAGCGHQKDG